MPSKQASCARDAASDYVARSLRRRAPPLRNLVLAPEGPAADFGYVTSFLAKGAPGDAYGKAPHWPRFESGSMKRAFINNATHIGDYVSEACDLWREVDATKLMGLLYKTLNLTFPRA